MKKPITSWLAYKDIGKFVDTHYMEIYEGLLFGGPQTCEKISSFSYLFDDQVYRRVSEMEKMGLIERMDWFEETSAGKLATVWWIK